MVVFTHTNALAKDFQNDRKKCQVICCEDDAQPPPFFGEMPHSWLKEQADYYEKVLTDYRAKCSRLQELKKKMRRQNNRMQSDLFHEVLPITEKWEYLEPVGRVEYLSQLIQIEAPPLPPEIAQEIEEAKKNRQLEHELRPSIQEKLIGYMG
ncbi:hypothetical protein RclHR1_16420003 [Rhizophagus clarus]|uniref:Uncharacterized protein n=1 Tax=Rhizophagus clarus TaxID=94130 RepID=A0A2Z6QY97_9GLOM|nr:hypothetical protein RclHR1_16420003 [Rhizophagus clarus]